MVDYSNWLNAGAATAAAIFSYLAWRGSLRVEDPEAVLSSAKIAELEEGGEYAKIHFSVRNLTHKTLYIRRVSFSPTRVPVQVSQDSELDRYGVKAKPIDFRGAKIERVGWMVVGPAGTPRTNFAKGDTLWTDVAVRFPKTVPEFVVAEITYSYGSPSGRKRKILTNREPLRRDAP